MYALREGAVMEGSSKQILFSGVQPSGTLTLGNYVGAIRNFNLLQDEYNCIFSVVDMHAITVRQEPAKLRRRKLELAALYIASGVDPQKNIIYCQSQVSGHAELNWVLGCFTYMGELNRMTQFKDKMAKHPDNINAGLYTYPVLMAADILLFGTNLVPVGSDQKQHLEIARDIAMRFNSIYGDVFTIPEGYFGKSGTRVMSLSDPLHKMSKSDSEDSYIAMLDEPDVIRRKLKRAVTDSDTEIRFDKENKPGVSNLLEIISALSNTEIKELEQEFLGKGYGELKSKTADVVIATLEPIQREHKKLMADKEYLQNILDKNAEIASGLSQKVLRKVYRKIGFR